MVRVMTHTDEDLEKLEERVSKIENWINKYGIKFMTEHKTRCIVCQRDMIPIY